MVCAKEIRQSKDKTQNAIYENQHEIEGNQGVMKMKFYVDKYSEEVRTNSGFKVVFSGFAVFCTGEIRPLSICTTEESAIKDMHYFERSNKGILSS